MERKEVKRDLRGFEDLETVFGLREKHIKLSAKPLPLTFEHMVDSLPGNSVLHNAATPMPMGRLAGRGGPETLLAGEDTRLFALAHDQPPQRVEVRPLGADTLARALTFKGQDRLGLLVVAEKQPRKKKSKKGKDKADGDKDKEKKHKKKRKNRDGEDDAAAEERRAKKRAKKEHASELISIDT